MQLYHARRFGDDVAMRCHALPAAADRASDKRAPGAKPGADLRDVTSAGRERIGATLVSCACGGACPRCQAPGESGLPTGLKAGVERLSGFTMDDVVVHRNSPEPAERGALAFTRGTDIHLAANEERHLPHEAWHVVQQKQGRVRPPAQLKTAAISEDAALEAEADRMGQVALVATPDTDRLNLQVRKPSGDPVIQPKLTWKGSLLPESKNFSPVSLRFIKSPESFLLRDDITPQEKLIHILNMRHKYLLGEVHGSGVWEKETKPWNVAKMTEGYKNIPHEPDDTSRIFDVPWDPVRMPDGQALESSHPFLFVSLMQARDNIEELLNVMQTSTDDSTPQDWITWVRGSLASLADIRVLYDYYKDFLQTFETRFKRTLRDPATKSFRAVPHRLNLILSVSTRLRNAYWQGWTKGSELFDLTTAITQIDALIRDPRPPKKGWSAPVAATIRKRLGFFVEVAKDVASIIAKDQQETRTLNEIMTNPNPVKRPDIMPALNPIRERSMAANITAAAPPLLVQLGAAHVDPVAKLVGADAVPIPPPRKLSDVTAKQ